MTLLDTDVAADIAASPDGGKAPPVRDARFAALVELVGQIAPIEIDAAALGRDSTLAGDLMLDSISLISLMALAEAHFGVALSEHSEDVANLRTLGDALDLLVRFDAAAA